jgi:transcriptional regulator with XRE-family HTH domain
VPFNGNKVNGLRPYQIMTESRQNNLTTYGQNGGLMSCPCNQQGYGGEITMGKIPEQLRAIIAANIRACRVEKFPGRGGGKRCAEAFGVSPQQWSPWERGMRTPDELRLAQIADFFGVTVEDMHRDHSAPDIPAGNPSPNFESGVSSSKGTPNDTPNRHCGVESRPPEFSFAYCPFYRPPKPGQPLSDNTRSLCWLTERFFGDVREFGITIRLHASRFHYSLACFVHSGININHILRAGKILLRLPDFLLLAFTKVQSLMKWLQYTGKMRESQIKNAMKKSSYFVMSHCFQGSLSQSFFQRMR